MTGARILTAFIFVALCANAAPAQVMPTLLLPTRAGMSATLPTRTQAAQANSSGAFALEALGGVAGSLVGMGITAAVSNCDVEDLACTLLTVGAGGALSAIGAAVGTTLVARQTESRRSIPGALVGSVVGTGVGLGVHYLLNRESDRNLGDKVVVPIFALAQGIFAAWGSRLAGK